MKMRNKKKTLLSLVMAALFVLCSFFPDGAAYAGQARNTEQGETEAVYEITDFAESSETGGTIQIYGRMPLERLLEKMPKTLDVCLEGQQGLTSIPVTWSCAGDYEGSSYYYYQFNPQWDEEQYKISEKAKKRTPYIGVSINPSAVFKFASSADNEKEIYQFLKDELGVNTAAACGILANIRSESAFNPGANVIDTNGLMSYGICQWNGPRFETLKSYCSQYGYDYRKLDGQLRYLEYELKHSEWSAFSRVKDVENSAEGAYQAGYNWARYFERCASVYFESRANYARDFYWPKYAGTETRKKYKVTYDLDGGKNNSSNPGYYYSDSGSITLEDPVKKGYTFEGWYTDDDWNNEIAEITSGMKRNLKLYACWTPNEYIVRFYGNHSTGGYMEEMEACEYNYSYRLPANSFKRKGYKFVKWNTKSDGSGKSYGNKQSVKNLSDKDGAVIKLYAQWSKNKYTITYKLNGGKAPKGNPQKYDASTKTFTLKNPAKKGYAFAGWYKESSYKTRVTQVKKGSAGNLILYAKWKANKYEITYKGNGATSGSMKEAALNYGKEFTLAPNEFKRKGYTFAGWNTKADGSGKSYKNQASVKSLTSTNKKTVTLYAQWKKQKYKIKYVLNHGVMVKNNRTSYYVDTKTFTLNKPERDGYTFAGWYTDSKFKNKITQIKKGSTKNLTLYAKWKAGTYKIVFDGNGADSGTTEAMTSCEFDKSYRLTANGFKKEGYQFIGWSTTPDGSEDFYGEEVKVKNLAWEAGTTVILYAQWEKIYLHYSSDLL